MNRILLVAFIMSLAACGNSQQEQSQPTPTPAPKPKMQVIMPQQTTTPPPSSSNVIDVQKAMEEQKKKAQSMRARSRPKNEIRADYPYDITLKTATGKEISSDKVLAANGKPTVLLFWLTTCTPCRYEMEAIKGKYANWQTEADFNFYAISTDFDRNYDAFVKLVNQKDWKWETYNDVNREFRNVMPGELNGLPQTFVLDKDGKIIYHKRKWKPGDEDVLFEKVKAAAKG